MMRAKPRYTVHYEQSRDGYCAHVSPRRGLGATSIGKTVGEARRNVRMALADLLDCGDFDFDLVDAENQAPTRASAR